MGQVLGPRREPEENASEVLDWATRVGFYPSIWTLAYSNLDSLIWSVVKDRETWIVRGKQLGWKGSIPPSPLSPPFPLHTGKSFSERLFCLHWKEHWDFQTKMWEDNLYGSNKSSQTVHHRQPMKFSAHEPALCNHDIPRLGAVDGLLVGDIWLICIIHWWRGKLFLPPSLPPFYTRGSQSSEQSSGSPGNPTLMHSLLYSLSLLLNTAIIHK